MGWAPWRGGGGTTSPPSNASLGLAAQPAELNSVSLGQPMGNCNHGLHGSEGYANTEQSPFKDF